MCTKKYKTTFLVSRIYNLDRKESHMHTESLHNISAEGEMHILVCHDIQRRESTPKWKALEHRSCCWKTVGPKHQTLFGRKWLALDVFVVYFSFWKMSKTRTGDYEPQCTHKPGFTIINILVKFMFLPTFPTLCHFEANPRHREKWS